MLLRLLLSLALLSAVLIVAGCEEFRSAEYKRGREEGKELGYQEGYRAGLAEGFEKSKPGSLTHLSGVALTVYKLLVWGGALKVCASLGLVVLMLASKSKGPTEVIGKVLFGVLGSVAAILVVTYLQVSKVADALLLMPAPSSLAWQVGWMLASAVGMYLLLEVLFRFMIAGYGPIAEGWVVLLLAGVLTIFAPTLFGLYQDVPDLTRYFAANLFAGALLGGLYHVGDGLLRSKFSPLSNLVGTV